MKNEKYKDRNWHNADSISVSMDQILKKISDPKYEIHVGCDSHKISGRYIFAVVIAAYEPRRGGIYFFKRTRCGTDVNERLDNLKIRLLREAQHSIEIANRIKELLGSSNITVHLDINPDKRFPSFHVLTDATSWVKSYGFECLVKPNSWAASGLADFYAK